eukprot:640368-Amphidinium_carterae.1
MPSGSTLASHLATQPWHDLVWAANGQLLQTSAYKGCLRRRVIAKLHQEDVARPESMTLVYMDGAVISLILSSKDSSTADDEASNGTFITNMQRNLTVVATKPLIGKEKFLNVLTGRGVRTPSYTKLLTRPKLDTFGCFQRL